MIHEGDCLNVLRSLDSASVDSIVTDPPYGLGDTSPRNVEACLRSWLDGDQHEARGAGFMGRAWDAWVPGPQVWRECLRVLKPGGHLLAFAGSRTVDLMGMALRLAGFEVRDCLQWLYGSGFPKSLDVSKAIDAQRNDAAEVRAVCRWLRARVDEHPTHTVRTIADVFGTHSRMVDHWAARDTDSQPCVPTDEQWDALRGLLGFGVDMDDEVARLNARKGEKGEAWHRRGSTATSRERGGFAGERLGTAGNPTRDVANTDAARQWSGWGTALKPAAEPILLCRKPLDGTVAANVIEHGTGGLNVDGCRVATSGRWPPNVVLTHTHDCAGDHNGAGCVDGCAVGVMGAQSGEAASGSRAAGDYGLMGYMGAGAAAMPAVVGDAGTAARFFPSFRYIAKAAQVERSAGLDARSSHPTVKPVDVMRWLVRLVTPPGGLVLDPFCGSGTTGIAASLEGFRFIGVEREPEYADIARQRIAWWSEHGERGVQAWAAKVAREEADARTGQMDMFG